MAHRHMLVLMEMAPDGSVLQQGWDLNCLDAAALIGLFGQPDREQIWSAKVVADTHDMAAGRIVHLSHGDMD